MSSWLYAVVIFVAGGLGSLCRYSVSILLPQQSIPWGTMVVNVVGAFLIGLLSSMALQYSWHPALRLGIVTGFLGGFTTYSAFSLESIILLGQNWPLALIYIGTTVVACLSMAALGMSVAHYL